MAITRIFSGVALSSIAGLLYVYSKYPDIDNFVVGIVMAVVYIILIAPIVAILDDEITINDESTLSCKIAIITSGFGIAIMIGKHPGVAFGIALVMMIMIVMNYVVNASNKKGKSFW